jgi:hypothetical protein
MQSRRRAVHHHTPTILVVGSLFLGAALGAAAPAAAADTPVTAYWGQHNEVDELNQLPKTYACDDLYYVYRDILFKLGARPTKIYTYGCTRAGQAVSGTPRVDLAYSAPRDTQGRPGFHANRQSIRLAPGDPKSLTADDCVLLGDMRQTVIASIASKIDDHGLSCDSPKSKKRFELVVEALLPAEDAPEPPTR